MAEEVGALYYDLNIDDKNLRRQLAGADSQVKGFSKRLSQYWGASVTASKTVLMGLAAVGAAAVAFGVKSVKAFQESQNAIAQTNAVLKSTKGIAGVTSDEVTRLATALQGVTRFSDEQVRSGQNLLLTFTKIGKDVFPQATETILDMSQALGQDTKSSAIQLGKALQDPILGVTALRRVGVNFSEAQKDVIKKLVETGQSAKAQKLILAELKTEFGGSARAAGETFAGKLDILKNTFGDLQEKVGEVIVNALMPLASAFSSWMIKVNEAGGLLEYLRGIFERNRNTIYLIAGAIVGVLVPAIIAMTYSFATFLATIAPWALLGMAVVLLFQHFKISISDVQNAFRAVANFLKGVFIPIWNVLKIGFDVLLPSVKALWNTILTQFLPSLKQLWDAVTRLWNALNPALMTAIKVVAAIIGGLLLAQMWLFINATKITWQVISYLISLVSNLIKWLANLASWYGNVYGKIINTVKGLPGVIKRAVGGLASTLYTAGVDLINGLIRGITNKFNAVKNTLYEMANTIKNIFSSVLKIFSPSKVFKGYGENIVQGFIQGITGSQGMIDKAMGGFAGNIISPKIGLANASAGSSANNSVRYGDTVVNIDTIQDRSDADYILRRIDRSQNLINRGGSRV